VPECPEEQFSMMFWQQQSRKDIFIFMIALLLASFACPLFGQSPGATRSREISGPSGTTERIDQNIRRVSLTPAGTVVGPTGDNGGRVFEVKAYGATGNGTIDDSAAIQAADNAAEAVHGVVHFDSGTYLISSTLKIASPVRWEGAFSASNSGTNSTIVKAGAALNPMINIGHSNVELDYLRIDGNAEAIEGIRTQSRGAEPRTYNFVLRSVSIQNFPLSNPSVIPLDLGDYGDSTNQYACADCSFYNIEVLSGSNYVQGTRAAGTGVYISRENNQFFAPHIAGWNIGVLLGGGSYGQASGNGFYGGFIADDRTADISVTSSATNIQNAWYNIWFEGSTGPIVGSIPAGSYKNQEFSFYNCHFNTYSNASLFDLTNLVGTVNTTGGAYDISNSNRIITSSLGSYQSFDTAYVGLLSFTGSNYQLMGFPIRGSVTLGTRVVPAGACGDQVTQTIPGIKANQTIFLSQNVLSDLLLVRAYTDSTPQIVVQLCNPTAAPITPSRTTVNYTIF
jgi:Pectate lyase superfamily protein